MIIFGNFFDHAIEKFGLANVLLPFIISAIALGNFYQVLFLLMFLESGITLTELRGENEMTRKALLFEIKKNDLVSEKLEKVTIQ